MGTTSKSASYSNYAVVEATATRVSNLLGAIPDDVSMEVHIHDVYSFTDLSLDLFRLSSFSFFISVLFNTNIPLPLINFPLLNSSCFLETLE